MNRNTNPVLKPFFDLSTSMGLQPKVWGANCICIQYKNYIVRLLVVGKKKLVIYSSNTGSSAAGQENFSDYSFALKNLKSHLEDILISAL